MLLQDALAHRVYEATGSAEAVAVALYAANQKLLEELIQLKSICPRRVTAPDGKVYVWHCPDHLIPEH